MTAPRWSVVIPAYNEARRLPPYLDEVAAYFEGRGEPHEIIVVDDGSTDGTGAIAAELRHRHPAVRTLRLPVNSGKGAAVRRGMLAARGDYRLFTDADGATPIRELKRLEGALEAGADVAIGSRAVPDPAVSVSARAHRVFAGRIFAAIVRRLGLPAIVDSQCGFKLFVGRVADDLFARVRTSRYGFDVELLLLARAAGYRVAEVPVNWADQEGSKVAVLTDGPRMLGEILRAWWRLRSPR